MSTQLAVSPLSVQRDIPCWAQSGFSHIPSFSIGLGVGLAWHFRGLCSRWWRSFHCFRFSRRCHSRAGHAGSADVVLRRRGYAVGYSYKHKCPLWASAIICPRSVAAFGERTAAETFTVDDTISIELQAHSEDFVNSGFDRGHLIARATASFDELSCEETYLMTNVVPQDPKLNRGPWRSFEKEIRVLTERYGRLGLVVGSHFRPNDTRTIGDHVGVPGLLFAAVIALDQPGKPSFGLLTSNKAPRHQSSLKWHEQFELMSIRDLERRLGRPIFRRLSWRQRPWFWQRRRFDRSIWV